MNTFQQRKEDVKRDRHLVDVKGKILGRVSVEIANYLMGKGKVSFTKNVDSGDFVVVINAKEVKLSGKKEQRKLYHHHSGYLGKLKTLSYQEVLARKPEDIIIHSVSGMIPDNRLKSRRLARLKVFAGSENPFVSKAEVKS